MAAISRKTRTSGTWETATDWSIGAVPTASDDGTIAIAPAIAGTPYVVSDTTNISVHSLTLDQPLATLASSPSVPAVTCRRPKSAASMARHGYHPQSGHHHRRAILRCSDPRR